MNGPTAADSIVTEFATQQFETELPAGAIDRLAAAVEGVVSVLRSQVVSDDRVEMLLRGSPGTEVFREEHTKERADPEPITRDSIVQPFLTELGYEDIAPEAGDFSSRRGKKADYSIPLVAEQSIDSNRLLIEVEPLNKRLDQTNHGLGQVKDWLELDKFEADFGIATDGLRWILIKYDRDTYSFDVIQEINLQPVFIASFENQTGRQVSLGQWLEDPSSRVLEEFYRVFSYRNFVSIASDAGAVIRRKKKQVTDEFYRDYIRLVFGTIEEDETTARSLVGDGVKAPEHATSDDVRLFAVGLMNRLIFVKFLEDRGLAPPNLLRELVDEYETYSPPSSFYRTYLERLFFGVLDERPHQREPRIQQNSLYAEVPYLNGGLFRPTVHQNDSLKDTDFDVRNSVLESIINLLERYSFTADGEPGDLDPSVLGNVFEKTINHITSGSDDRRKQLGAYYTPDEITRFTAKRTVRPTLLQTFGELLIENWDWSEGEVDAYGDIFALIDGISSTNLGLIEDLIDEVDSFRALDPACGSGHFLTSVQSEIVAIRKALYEKHDDNPPEWELRKRTVIQNVYGVDIEEPAVEIAKLRLWLSIITAVDPHNIDEYAVDDLALPNVIFNIQNGNSLVGFTDLIETKGDGKQSRLSSWEEDSVKELYGEIIDEMNRHREAESTEEAYDRLKRVEELKSRYRPDLNEKVLIDYQEAGASDAMIEDIEDLRPFHWVLEFAQVYAVGGFDIVVGNPPYVRIYRGVLDEMNVEYWRNRFKSAHMKFDLYVLFMELSIDLARPGGMVSLIVPHKFTSTPYGEPLRKKILEETEICTILDVRDEQVFHGVSVANVVPVLRKGDRKRDEFPVLKRGEDDFETDHNLSHTLIEAEEDYSIRLSKSPTDAKISEHITSKSIRFDSIYYVNWGLRTGTSELTEKYVVDSPESEKAKPMIRGEDIVERYQLADPDEYIIYEKESLYNPMFEELFENPKIVFRKITGQGLMAVVDESDLYCFSTLIPCVNIQHVSNVNRPGIPEQTEKSERYLNPYFSLSLVNSSLMRWYYMKNLSDNLSVVPGHIQQLPIVDIGLEAGAEDTDINDLIEGHDLTLDSEDIVPCLDQVEELLEAAEHRPVHDFVSYLGKSMSEYNEDLLQCNTKLLDYIEEPQEGRKLSSIGAFEFPTEAEESIIDETRESKPNLRAGRAIVEGGGHGEVTVLLTARYKPENGASVETDRWGYVETDPIPALEVSGLSDIECGLLQEFVPIAVDEGGGFAGFRENATKTMSLRNRLSELSVPSIESVEDDFRDYLDEVEKAEEIKRKIKLTDSLIDEIVYYLYGLSDDEIEHIKENVH